MKKKLSKLSKSTGVKYVSSGLFKTFAITVSGIVILRWLQPEELGKWQSFLVFIGYIQILTLGTTSGLNREIAYLIGKNKLDEGIRKLKTVGYYTTALSISLMGLIILVGIIFYFLNILTLELTIMFILAFLTGALRIQTSFLAATFRSSRVFLQLSKIQYAVSSLYFLLLPLIYYYQLWGYIIYQVIITLALYFAYYIYRPYKVKYTFEKSIFVEMIKIGMPMYVWNYLAAVSRSIPRLILLTLGGPLMVGLYSPAGSVNTAFLSLPLYINRYLFPQMSHIYGKTGNMKKVYDFTISAVWKLFFLMSFFATVIAVTIPYVIAYLFPKYSAGIPAIQITVFSGVFFCLNTMMHSAINSLKNFSLFKLIISMRFLFIIIFTGIGYLIFDSLLVVVSFGALIAEMFNFFNYWRSLYLSTHNSVELNK